MIVNKQKIKLFTYFGIPPITCSELGILKIYEMLTIGQWCDYITELKNIMLSQLEEHDAICRMNMDDATCYLMLVASDDDKIEALSKAIGIYSF